MSKIKMYMGLPNTGNRHDAQCVGLRRMEAMYGDRIEFIYPEISTQRLFHDHARNAIVDEFMASKADLLWFLDSDVAPPVNVLDIVVDHYDKWQLAGAPYPVFLHQDSFNGPAVTFTVYQEKEGRLMPAPVPHEGTDFVAGIATGCLFIKREVIEKLSKPYFEFKYDNETRKMTEGEDLGFCRKVGALGYKFFIDYAKVCKHFKYVDLLDVNNYAMTFATQMVNATHRAFLSARAESKLGLTRPKSGLILPK